MTVVPVSAFVALGANLGDAAATVRQAITDLGTLPQTRLVRASRLYRSAPWEASGPDFFNAVTEVATLLDAHALLAALHGLEQAAGRERPYLNAPRTLDLDLLLYGDDHIATPSLTVPHPRMDQRAFVLRPLAEIAPDKVSATALAAVAAQDARPL
ncbi:2-amino-4-hydroxy-6-hydroxymethyldihydropteridine diphosphokinase [Hydrogenophaga defluvii]|uniref:2-amino-4-hydroxy-6-hydroxymethyldihydropteridine pyrophosphokinase n=1 Tax=Hydrogenophaga defluvii TaxID=249410 RepID=A0ABW2S932_9BURK